MPIRPRWRVGLVEGIDVFIPIRPRWRVGLVSGIHAITTTCDENAIALA